MSEWRDAARAAGPGLIPANNTSAPCSVSSVSSDSILSEKAKTAVFRLTELSELLERGNESEKAATDAEPDATCFLCGQPVERGTPGTGALAGQDLHMDCYWKKYPSGHQRTRHEPTPLCDIRAIGSHNRAI